MCGLLFPVQIQAQKEMNWWYFGYNAGLNFNDTQTVTSLDGVAVTGMPKPVLGPLSTSEGCFTLSDSQGNLLMSSDGSTIYNKKNQVMSNGTGLLGDNSATQSGIVVPAPNDTNKFYVLTVATEDQPSIGLRYSVVNIDVTDPNDMGSVELTTKNSLLKTGPTAENITVIRHKNGIDYWLVHRTGELFYVWLLNDQGFSATPKTYKIPALPLVKGKIPGGYIGELIVSVDTRKLVNFCSQAATIISADFDNSTGVVADVKLKSIMPAATSLYGGTFSSNGEYLYIGNTIAAGIKNSFKIKYSDLRAGDVNLSTIAPAAINYRLGPDKRVYGIFYAGGLKNEKRLIVITDPDEGGNNVKVFSDYLVGASDFGLPNFAMLFLSLEAQLKPFSCAGYDYAFAIRIAVNSKDVPTKLVWDFGDGSPTIEQTFIKGNTEYKSLHFYKKAGIFKVMITPYKGTTALPSTTFEAKVIECNIKSNRMIRLDLS